MKTLGNILWHIPFLGFIQAILAYLFGLLLTLTIVAAPIGLGLMEYGKYLFAPFSRAMITKDDLNVQQNIAWKAYSLLVRIVYFPFGLILALFGAFQVIALFLTIIGIPAALVVAKSLGVYFNPVNKKCVSGVLANELEIHKAKAEIAKHFNQQ